VSCQKLLRSANPSQIKLFKCKDIQKKRTHYSFYKSQKILCFFVVNIRRMLEIKEKILKAPVVIRSCKKDSKDNQIRKIGARLIQQSRRKHVDSMVKNLRRIRCQDFSPDNITKNFKNVVNKMN